MTLWSTLRHIVRSLRRARARHAMFVSCVAVGVGAVVSVAALAGALREGLATHARELLGADVAVESRQPLPDTATWLVRAPAARVSLIILPTTVRNERGASRLAELKAIDAHGAPYPLAGTLKLEPARPLEELLDARSVLVARELAEALALQVGAELGIGQAQFRVAGLIDSEPDAQLFSLAFGPRVLLTHEALARAALLGFGSRVRHRALLVYPDVQTDELASLRDELAAHLPTEDGRVTVESRLEALPALRSTLERVARFLGLIALLSLLVASAGIALLVAAFARAARPEIAVMRCLGARPRDVFLFQLGRVALLASIGSTLGAALGCALGRWLLLGVDALPHAESQLFAWQPVVRGLALGIAVPCAFAAQSLAALWEVSPAEVLRSDAQPLARPPWLSALVRTVVLSACFGAAWLEAHDLKLALGFSAGVAALVGALALALRALRRALARVPRERVPPLAWHGLSAIARPGSDAASATTALGAGVLVLCIIVLVEGLVHDAVRVALPADAPNAFLVDVQPDQWAEVARIAQAHGATHVQSAPVVMARLAAIDGRAVEELARARRSDATERSRAHWVLTREQRITYGSALPRDNRILAGALFVDPAVPEVSLEKSFADDLEVGLGSVLQFDVQGVPLSLTVTSLRSVEWRSFAVNFFLVAEPGPLDDAPQFRIAAMQVPERAEQALQDALGARFPNISMLRVRGILARIVRAIDQAAWVVRLLGGFALAAGVSVVLASVVGSEVRRRREVALLRALGLTSAELRRVFALEYTLVGALAASVGGLFAFALTWLFARYALRVDTLPSLAACAATGLGALALVVVGGLAASAGARRAPPAEVLRD